ncbi:MAG: hypothetical protein RL705_1755 [Bacteroidota bacterium]|jgi:hypothetical protein
MKTNFLNKLKQGLFLLIAVLGTFIGYSQPNQVTTIGGKKTPDIGIFFDVGGKKNPGPVIFANQSTSMQCDKIPIFEIGGRSLDPGLVAIVLETGGKQKPEPILINIENNFGKDQEKFSTKSIVQGYMNKTVKYVLTESKRVKVPLIV